MARKKPQRRRSLSGSPAHHANAADRLVDDIVAHLEESQRLTAAGRCGESIANLRAAHRLDGQVTAHAAESERPKLRLDLLSHYDHQMAMAEGAFAKKCIVKRARK